MDITVAASSSALAVTIPVPPIQLVLLRIRVRMNTVVPDFFLNGLTKSQVESRPKRVSIIVLSDCAFELTTIFDYGHRRPS